MTNLLSFSIFLVITALIYWFLIPVRWRSLFLLICSIFFAALFSIHYAFYFLFNITLVYAAGIFIGNGRKKRSLWLSIALVWLIGNLCFLKYIAFPKILFPLGLSYLTFRLIHYIVEVYKGNIQRTSFVDFALYVLFFPTFLAGPIERFQKFYPQTKAGTSLDIANINYGLFRIILGLVRKVIIADNLKNVIAPILFSPQSYHRPIVILAVYGLVVQIYMDFAGYTDMAIGASRIFGYKIVENFNRPLLQKNIALFWRNWHISFYTFIRDYLFFPAFGYRSSTAKTYLGLFVSFLIFNLWHKISLGFLISGIYFGTGLMVWYAFQDLKRRKPFFKKITAFPYSDIVSIFFTFNFICFGVIFSLYNAGGALGIIQRVFR